MRCTRNPTRSPLIPAGSRSTTSVRLMKGKANSSAERISASMAAESVGTRSPSPPVCASWMVGSVRVRITVSAIHPTTTAHRARTTAVANARAI